MKQVGMGALLVLAAGLYAAGCNCGHPPPGLPDAGCGPDTCAACPPGCTSADTCGGGAWSCTCTCTASATNVCAEQAQSACDFFIRCHSEPSAFFDVTEGRAPPLPGISMDQVAASERARCEARLSSAQGCALLLESFKAGRSRFDPVNYSACTAVLYPPDACARDLNVIQERCLKPSFVDPATAPGGLCEADRECDGGWCNASGANACGTCQPYLAGGAACTRGAQCDPATSYCSSVSNTCAAYHAPGDTCAIAELTSCGPNQVCALSGFLLYATCVQGKQEGQHCVMNRYQCNRSGRALPELLCERVPVDGGTDTQCVKLQSGSGGRCGDGEYIVPPLGGAPAIYGPLCPETEYCSQKTCVARKGAAAPCASDDECAASLHCLPSDGGSPSCQPYQDLQGSCDASTDCKNLLACNGSECIPDLALNGEACDGGQACAEGYCDTAGAAPRCAAYKDAGEGCAVNEQCYSSLCNTTCQQACWEAP